LIEDGKLDESVLDEFEIKAFYTKDKEWLCFLIVAMGLVCKTRVIKGATPFTVSGAILCHMVEVTENLQNKKVD
jgi:hypothetical protein